MKCAFILLAILAFCYSSQVDGGKKVSIGKDGSIQILGQYGRWIVISKNGQNREKDIEIAVGGPFGVHKKIHIDEVNNSKSASFQEPLKAESNMDQSGKLGEPEKKNPADILSGIFQQYQGVVDDQSYNNLLQKVYSYVQSGDLDASVYDVLNGINASSNQVGKQSGMESVSTSGNGIQQNGLTSGSPLTGNRGGIQYGIPNGLRQNDGKVPFGYQNGFQYPLYGNVINGQRYAVKHVDEFLPSVSRELLVLYKPQQSNFYQQWMNQMEQVQYEQQSYTTYLQLINIQQSELSPAQQNQLIILQQQWISFQNQLNTVEQQQLSHLHKQWINCEQVLNAEQYQCDNLQKQWNHFQQNLGVEQRQLLNSIYEKWVAFHQELSLGQLSQLEQLWSTLYQRWVRLDLTIAQQQQLSDILPRLTNYNLQRQSGKWTEVQQRQFNNILKHMAKLLPQLSVEQQQELNKIYRIIAIISRLQINPGEWIQLKHQLKRYMIQLVSDQQGSEYFLRLHQIWVVRVENLVNFEQTLYNIYQQWVSVIGQLNFEQLQQFRNIYPRWVSLRIEEVNGILTQFHKEQYEIVQGQLMYFLQQLSIAQQHSVKGLLILASLQYKVDGESWSMLEYHLNVFVQRMIASDEQSIKEEDQQLFYDIYKFWVDCVSRRVDVEQKSTFYEQSQNSNGLVRSEYPGLEQSGLLGQQQPMYLQDRQSSTYNPWRNYILQKVKQRDVVPQQLFESVFY